MNTNLCTINKITNQLIKKLHNTIVISFPFIENPKWNRKMFSKGIVLHSQFILTTLIY